MAVFYGQDDRQKQPVASQGCTEASLQLALSGQAICALEEIIQIDDTQDFTLNLGITDFVPVWAQIQVEDPNPVVADERRVALYTIHDGQNPLTEGWYAGNFTVLQIGGGVNITFARFRGVAPGVTVNLRVKYFQ